MDTTTIDPKAFGERLRALRMAEGLTQKALGGERFSHAYISSLESGRRSPSASAVLYLSERLGQELIGSLVPFDLDLREVLRGLPEQDGSSSRLLELILECVRWTGQPPLQADVLRTIGEFHVVDRPDLAETFLLKAVQVYRSASGGNSRDHLGRCLYLLGTIAEPRDQEVAASHFREAAALFA